MPRPRALVVAATVSCALLLGCGEEGIDIASDSPDRSGAEIFDTHCAACHTLDVTGAQGSAVDVNSREYKDGPNFNVRKEEREDVLYAIRNGGFSSGPMPQDIVVGEAAERVADFVAEYSGRDAASAPTPSRADAEGGEAGGTP